MSREVGPTDIVFAIPTIVKMLWRVVRDDRVPWWIRGGLIGVAGYLALPWDVVPDWIPVLGQVDDFVILTVGGRMLLRQVDPDVLTDHWDGDPAVLARVLGRDAPAPEPKSPEA